MTGSIVIDASVALKLVVPEASSDAAEALLGVGMLIAPELMLLECGNALWGLARRGALEPAEAERSLARLMSVPIGLTADRSLAQEALRLGHKLGHPIYDCIYLALALERGTVVVTADRRFADAAARAPDVADRVRLLHDIASTAGDHA